MKQASFNFLALTCLAACACTSGAADDSAAPSGSGNSTSSAGRTSAAGSGSTGGTTAHGGSASSAGGSSIAGSPSSAGSSSSGGNGAGGMGAGNMAGSGGMTAAGGGSAGAPPAAGPGLTTHPVGVDGKGTVFNEKDNFFSDYWVPRFPVSDYGFPSHVIPVQQPDGSLDVAWLDYAKGGRNDAPGLEAPATVYVTHIGADLSTSSTVSTGIQTYRLLGFTLDPSGNFYIAYNQDSSFRTHDGKANDKDGNELRVAKFANGSLASKTWDALIFGDVDNTKDGSKGEAGATGSGVLAYDAKNNQIVVYVAHTMSWGDNGTRHEAGFLAYIDPGTGKEQASDRNLFMGANWWYSHDFNQRMKIDADGTAWILCHGDSYPRQLGISSFTYDSYKSNNAASDNGYFKLDGNAGENDTNAETGQFVHLSDGRFAIVHTSSQGRTMRDAHVVITDNTGKPTADSWLTNNTGSIQGVTTKIETLGSNLWVTYGLWDSNENGGLKTVINYYAVVLGTDLKVVTPAAPLMGVEMDQSPPLFKFTAGPNNGAIAWVSGNSMHTLTVNVFK